MSTWNEAPTEAVIYIGGDATQVGPLWFYNNIPQSPAYGVFVSQLIRYARASSLYEDFIMRSQLLTSKLLKQGFTRNRLIATFKKFYGRHSVLVDRFKVSVTNIIIDLFLETLYH